MIDTTKKIILYSFIQKKTKMSLLFHYILLGNGFVFIDVVERRRTLRIFVTLAFDCKNRLR